MEFSANSFSLTGCKLRSLLWFACSAAGFLFSFKYVRNSIIDYLKVTRPASHTCAMNVTLLLHILEDWRSTSTMFMRRKIGNCLNVSYAMSSCGQEERTMNISVGISISAKRNVKFARKHFQVSFSNSRVPLACS